MRAGVPTWVVIAVLLGPAWARAQDVATPPDETEATPAVAADAAPAEPTEEQLAAARESFGLGVQALQEERWEDAVARFREVMAVRVTSGVKVNLGNALSHTDELVEATRLLREAIEDPELDPDTRQAATELLASADARTPRLTVWVDGDASGVTVLIDEEVLPPVAIGTPYPIDPGAHVVTSQRDGVTVDTASVSLEEEGTAEVTVAAGVPMVEAPPAAAGPNVLEEPWFWAVVGGAVLVGAGVGIGVAIAIDEAGQPTVGNLDPGVLMVMPP